MAEVDLSAILGEIREELAVIRDALLALALFQSEDQRNADAAKAQLSEVLKRVPWKRRFGRDK